MLKKSYILLIAIGLQSIVHAQSLQEQDTIYDNGDEPMYLILRPTVGLGAGMFTFYGDVGENNKGYHPTVSRVGYDLSITNPLNDFLDINFYVLFGKLSANERSLNRNLNFESKITTGGVTLSYNFDHLLKEDRVVEPYLSTGIESFEFLSKTDLFDANGNEYNYWSDGSIRSLPEDDENASQAVFLNRDYVYESDLRELNLDGFGQYQERSWAIPLGVGANLLLSEKLNFRVGTSMHFAFTDLVDNVTHESVGDRKGDDANDKFLFTSFAVTYNMQFDNEKEFEEKSIYELRYLAFDGEDSDGDQVNDFVDDCAFTPRGIGVDLRGCPLDTDADGIPDYLDKQLNTPAGSEVNKDGIALTDADFELAYKKYVDSLGTYVNIVRTETSSGIDGVPARFSPGRTYMVQIGASKKGISANEIASILSIPDVRTIYNGDTTMYVVGDYSNIPEAVRRKLNLEKQGYEGNVLANDGGEIIDISDDVTVLNLPDPKSYNGPAIFRVQVGAYKNPLSENVFTDVPQMVKIKGDDGLTRYFSGSFTDFQKAANHRIDLHLKGYQGAFIVAFQAGNRVTLESAGATIADNGGNRIKNAPVEEISLDEPVNAVDKKLVSFSVQVGAYRGQVPTEKLNKMLQIGQIQVLTAADGINRYIIGTHSSYEEAIEAKKAIVEGGVENAFVVGNFNGKYITAEEAQSLLDE